MTRDASLAYCSCGSRSVDMELTDSGFKSFWDILRGRRYREVKVTCSECGEVLT